ncbi:MAG: hypothetical protein ACI3XQ_09695 [Eubacteriales bacterium]
MKKTYKAPDVMIKLIKAGDLIMLSVESDDKNGHLIDEWEI